MCSVEKEGGRWREEEGSVASVEHPHGALPGFLQISCTGSTSKGNEQRMCFLFIIEDAEES